MDARHLCKQRYRRRQRARRLVSPDGRTLGWWRLTQQREVQVYTTREEAGQ